MATSKQFAMTARQFAPEIRFGCIELRKADALELDGANVQVSPGEMSLLLVGAKRSQWNGISHVAVHMFSLPRRRTEFQRQVEWFGRERRSRARLPEGVKFDAAVLAIVDPPDGWEHEAFPRSGRDFVHIYRSAGRAVLIRLATKAGTVLDHPLLKHVHENLRIVADQWIADIPEIHRRESSAFRVTDRGLSDGVKQEIDESAARARDSLKLTRHSSPSRTVEAVHEAIEMLRRRRRVSKNEKSQFAIDHGALWGEALCAATGWEWRCVQLTVEDEVVAVCSGTRSHAVDPIRVIYRVLTTAKADNNALLLFNMIVSGELPQAAEAGFCWVS